MSPILIGILALVSLGVIVATWKAPRLTSIILWSTLAAIMVSAAFGVVGPGPVRERVLWVLLLFPIPWVAFQFWCYWEQKPWRVVTGLISLSMISGAIIMTVDMQV